MSNSRVYKEKICTKSQEDLYKSYLRFHNVA